MKTEIRTNSAPSPIGPYSQAIKHGKTLYASGQIAIAADSGELITNSIEEETHQVMKNIEAILTEAGMNFNNIVKCSIFTIDLGLFSRINEVYGSYFEEVPPARETVEVSALPKGVTVEISFIAIEN